MAVVARLGGDNMFGWFSHRCTAVMATRAEFRRALENTSNMTGFAIHFKVLAAERKTCGEMIEITILHSVSGHW
jgi:hypothetical protein